MDTRPLAALCNRITEEIGPWPAATPEARRMSDERHQAAMEAPFTLRGVEVAHLVNVAKFALGLRYVYWKPDSSQAEKRAVREALVQALNGADLTLGHLVEEAKP